MVAMRNSGTLVVPEWDYLVKTVSRALHNVDQLRAKRVRLASGLYIHNPNHKGH